MEIGQLKSKNKYIFFKRILIYGLVMHADILFRVNGQVLTPNEANSSPSQITVNKGSSVWLHWNYTYIGDGTHGGIVSITTNYIEQIIGFNSTSQPTIQALAKRIGQNGILTLLSSIPVPFNGRVEVISSNSTLVIHGLLYNDSSYQFSSNVIITLTSGGGSPAGSTYNLKPIVSITVNGIPDFITQPPSTLDVTEQSNLQIRIEMDGNPKPSADFKWTHLPSSTMLNVPSVQLYPFVYTSTYSLNNIDGSYCGRILQTTIKNSIGSSSSVKSTNVTVLLKLDKTFNLKAGKIAASKCVEVKWDKVESGACFVKYDVKLKDAFGNQLYNKILYNIGELKMCNLSDIATIANVELMVSFKSTYKNITAKVSETPITTPAPPTTQTTKPSTNQNDGSTLSSPNAGSSGVPTSSPKKDSSAGANTVVIVGASVGGFVFLLVVILIVYICIKKSKRSKRDHDSGGPDHPLQEKPESQYVTPGEVGRKKPQESTYADPNSSALVYGKLGDRGGDRPRHTRREETSDYADVKVDETGYPAVGAMPTSYTDGYGEKSRSRGDSGRDSGRRVVPDRRPPPPYNDYDDRHNSPVNVPPVYAQVNKSRKR